MLVTYVTVLVTYVTMLVTYVTVLVTYVTVLVTYVTTVSVTYVTVLVVTYVTVLVTTYVTVSGWLPMTMTNDYGFVLRSCYIAASERTTEHQRLSTSDQRASAVCSLQVSSSQQRVGRLPSYEVRVLLVCCRTTMARGSRLTNR
jgi:hypothetical protein